ncbi:MAG: exosortase/archaeosortase family protein [Verrucomicrobiota bacterium]
MDPLTAQTNPRPPSAAYREMLVLFPSGLAMVWLVAKAQWFWNHRPDLQFGWIVLLLCVYLLWEAWEKRPAFRGLWTIATGTLVGLALPLLFLVQIYQAAYGTNAASVAGLALALMLLVAGNVGYAFGARGIYHFGFAFGFLLIALPMPSALHNLVVGTLQGKIAMLNVEILNLIGVPARQVGSLIRLPTCTVGVDEACSGIRSLQSTLMATLFIGYLTLTRLGTKVWLVIAGIILAIVGNLLRSLFLSYTANAKGLHALETAHDTAGWSILIFTAAGVTGLAWLLSRAERTSVRDPVPATRLTARDQA